MSKTTVTETYKYDAKGKLVEKTVVTVTEWTSSNTYYPVYPYPYPYRPLITYTSTDTGDVTQTQINACTGFNSLTVSN